MNLTTSRMFDRMIEHEPEVVCRAFDLTPTAKFYVVNGIIRLLSPVDDEPMHGHTSEVVPHKLNLPLNVKYAIEQQVDRFQFHNLNVTPPGGKVGLHRRPPERLTNTEMFAEMFERRRRQRDMRLARMREGRRRWDVNRRLGKLRSEYVPKGRSK